MKRLSHVHKHTLDLDLRRLKWEGDWTRSHVPTSGFVLTTMVKEVDTMSCANLSVENPGFEWPGTGKYTPCPLAS